MQQVARRKEDLHLFVSSIVAEIIGMALGDDPGDRAGFDVPLDEDGDGLAMAGDDGAGDGEAVRDPAEAVADAQAHLAIMREKDKVPLQPACVSKVGFRFAPRMPLILLPLSCADFPLLDVQAAKASMLLDLLELAIVLVKQRQEISYAFATALPKCVAACQWEGVDVKGTISKLLQVRAGGRRQPPFAPREKYRMRDGLHFTIPHSAPSFDRSLPPLGAPE